MPWKPRPGMQGVAGQPGDTPDRALGLSAGELAADFGGPLPADGSRPGRGRRPARRQAEPGLMAMPSGRFFGWVIGGTLPAALAADWLASAWDQNAGCARDPGRGGLEEAAGGGSSTARPAGGADVGFTTGATMANFTGLAAARAACWRRRLGRRPARADGAPADPLLRRRGAARHGRPRACATSGWAAPVVAADRQGRTIRPSWTAPWTARSAAADGPGARVPAGRQPALRRLRPVRRGDRRRARARRLGARGRRVRALGGGRPRRSRHLTAGLAGRLLGDRRAQDPQRALRLRDRDRRGTPGRCVRPWACTPAT